MGVHVSISGKIFHSIDRAKAIGCTAMQIFSHNPRGWKVPPLFDEDVRIFKEKLNESKIHPLVVHTSYLINLASPDEDLYKRSIDSFKLDLERADMLGATFLVTHIGSSKDRDLQYGMKRASDALNSILDDGRHRNVKILLENTAGSGSIIGYTLNQIKEITESVKKDHSLGLCFDTCHGFASGYDLRDTDSIEELINEIDSFLGMDRFCLIHLNDSKGSLGSFIDRHEHIGKGKIGIKGFDILINHRAVRDMPMILETPKKEEQDDVKNLFTVKRLRNSMGS